MDDKVPFLSLNAMHDPLKEEMMSKFNDLLDKKWFILGNYLKAFESEYAKFNKVDYCVGVSNGLDALILSLTSIGIGSGDEVIIPSNTYIATALAISHLGAIPIFVEPKIDTFNLDPALIEQAITERTRAIIPVHLYGQACEMTDILKVAKKYNLNIIEDNAQSQGASFNNQFTGSFGDINATSFYPGKNIGALGDAGAVTTNDARLAIKVQLLRNYGSNRKYFNEVIGYNKRLDEIHAAILSIKLKHLKQWNSQRQLIAKNYDKLLSDIGDLKLPVIALGSTHVFHLYVIRSKYRSQLQEYLKMNNVETLIHYPIPIYKQKAYEFLNHTGDAFPVSDKLASEVLSLPIYPGLSIESQEYIALIIKSFFNEL